MSSQLYIATFGAAVLANIALAFVVWRYAPRTASRWLFSFFVFVQVAWMIITYISFSVEDSSQYLFWARLTMFGATLHAFSFFVFIYSFLEHWQQLQKKFLIPMLVVWAVVASLTLSPLVFSKLEPAIGGELVPIPGPAIPAFGIFVGFCIIGSFYLMIRRYRHAEGAERFQWQYLAVGVILTFLLTVGFSFMAFILSGSVSTVKFSHVYTLPFVLFTAYAMIKHRLLDIRPIIARTMTYVFLTIIVALVYITVLFLATTFAFDLPFNPKVVVMSIILTAVIALSFERLHTWIAKWTDRVFFRASYDPEELLSGLTRIMAATINLQMLTDRILTRLLQDMRITKGAFVFVGNHAVEEARGIGYQPSDLADARLEGLFHARGGRNQSVFVFEYLEDDNLRMFFRQQDIVVAIPIMVERDEVAVLALGPKASGELYGDHDIAFLTTFASEAGIAIQNAKAYNEIQKFNKELEQRVEDRTKELQISQKSELAKAQAVAKLKDEFVFVAAHELRTPVTVIKGFLELVAGAKARFPKDVKDHLKSIASASDNLGQLVNDLLEIARSDAGSMKVETSPVELLPIIKSLVAEVSPLAAKRHVAIEVEAPKKIPRVLADVGKVKEVMLNLLSNAIKYNRPDGAVNVRVILQQEYLSIEVHDTGFGIPKSQQGRIFEKFFRATTKNTQDVMGTGLGLFITKMLVEKMGGHMTFASVEGQGSTFSFSLPISTGQ